MTSGIFFTSVLTRTTKVLKTVWWMTLVIWLVAIAPAQASLIMLLAIEEGVERVKVGSSTNAVIRDGLGRAIAEIEPRAGFGAKLQAGKISMGQWIAGQIWIEPEGDGYVWIGDRWYRGKTHLIPHKGGITAINYVDLEEYLYSVLGAEMDGNWPHEALKAQAVAARSYALNKQTPKTSRRLLRPQRHPSIPSL
jgi:stage II sporulation protein D